MIDNLPESIQRLRDHGVIRDVDLAFAGFIAQVVGEGVDECVLVTATLVSRAVADGHICLQLKDLAGTELPGEMFPASVEEGGAVMVPIPLPPLAEWRRALADCSACVGSPDWPLLLVLDAEDRLYLHRYWQYERIVVERLRELARPRVGEAATDALAAGLNANFGPGGRQRLAAYCAWRSRLAIISGGPGTGKTYTIARIVEMLTAMGGETLRVRLAAPTGKAANRMVESIRAAKLDDVAVPEEAQTLHRLLGSVSGSNYFRHNRDNPIVADIIVVDEASMIDLPMMAKLLDAIGPETRLILLGDMDQLASVEPGAVFGDICRSVSADAFSRAFLDAYASDTGGETSGDGLSSDTQPGMQDCLVRLSVSRRFPALSLIGRIASSINAGDADGAWRLCSQRETAGAGNIHLHDAADGLRVDRKRPRKYLRERILQGYRLFLSATTPAEALAALDGFRILCASRRGPFGVGALNRLVEEVLSFRQTHDSATDHGLERALNPSGTFYDHRPILVTENDYDSGLFNGDIGVVLTDRDPDSPTAGQRLVWFPATDGGTPRSLSPNRLPTHETAFAMTIHKSQGSEFTNLLVVLPAEPSPLVSRELLYTAITRIKPIESRPESGRIDLVCSERTFRAAVRTATFRHSGIATGLLEPEA